VIEVEPAASMNVVRYIAINAKWSLPKELRPDKFDVIMPRGVCKGSGGTGGMSSEVADIDIIKLVRVPKLLIDER